MFTQTATVFHRTVGNTTDTWSPITLLEVHAQWIDAVSGNAQNMAETADISVLVPIRAWNDTIVPGDYIVKGISSVEEFTGSPAKFLSGEKQILSIKPNVYGSALDHVKLVCR